MTHDDWQLPEMHPREKNVLEAQDEIRKAIRTAISTHSLSTGEVLRVVASCLTEEIGAIATYAIRRERHKSADKPGGLL